MAVGGRGTLVGAILGAILVNFGKTWFTGALPEIWLYALGAMFIFVTLFLPRGSWVCSEHGRRRSRNRSLRLLRRRMR